MSDVTWEPVDVHHLHKAIDRVIVDLSGEVTMMCVMPVQVGENRGVEERGIPASDDIRLCRAKPVAAPEADNELP